MFITVILSSLLMQAPSVSLPRVAANIVSICIETESDNVLARDCENVSDKGLENSSDIRELYLKVPMSDDEMESLSSSQCPDGSWPDINYRDTQKGSWQPSIHAIRIHRLAIKYYQSGEQKAMSCALKAIDYWFSAPLTYTNWWHKEIGIPRLLGPAFVMLKDCMSEGQLKKAIAVMSAARIGRSGQNKVWLAGNVLLRSILENDEVAAASARDAIISELHFSDDEEGVQPDYSFHQHGPQFQNGNYGLSFAVSMSFWARVLDGTGLDFPQHLAGFLRAYICKALVGLVWKGRFDPNACARQVFPDAQTGKALCVRYAALNMGIDPESIRSATFYPYSDFGVFRGNGWYASIRMQSTHTIGFETTNSENMKGYFSADGALCVRVTGDEYDNIWPVWDWHHIPGTTTWDDGAPIWGKRNGNGPAAIWPYNNSPKVSGIVKDNCMIAAMDYNRDSLSGRKAWFFFDGGIICLGAGITRHGNAKVTTTIEQNLQKGRICKGKDFVRHRGISYHMLNETPFETSTEIHEGAWNWMSPALSGDIVRAPVFETLINHGNNPVNASYAYAVIPGKRLALTKRVIKRIRILKNTPDQQRVYINGKVLTINWEPFTLHIE